MSNDRDAGGDKGRTVGGRYRLLERIGSGGMGTVWRARDELVDREVAVKEPRLPGEPGDESHRRAAHRLYREARAAARVDHPSAVSIHDVVVEEGEGEDGLPWIVMELVRGESLHEVLKRAPVEPAECARIGLAVLGALRAAHAVGIVHRDVKPANVLLGPHGRVVLTDFGIAHIQGEESLTVSGEFVGSLEFIAPERMSGRGAAGPASDLWSLGVLLYAAVEGWSPFRRTTLESTLAAILAADPPEPKQAGPLGPLLTRLLAKDPALRPDPEEAEATLEAIAGEERPEEWPTVDAPEGEGQQELQDASGLREFGDDARTVRLGAGEADGGEAGKDSVPDGVPGGVPVGTSAGTRRPLRRRTFPLALFGGLLVGAAWLGLSFLIDSDSDAITENTATDRSASPTFSSSPSSSSSSSSSPSLSSSPTLTGGPTSTAWTSHTEQAMSVALSLPAEYEEFARQGSASHQPRMVEYAAGSVEVRLTEWDKAPGTPMSQAKQHAATFTFYGNAATQYTATSLHGWDAVQADTSYGDDGTRRRAMELFVHTDDGRMYELRVDMPKGTPEEKQGTAVFKEARDRLEITES